MAFNPQEQAIIKYGLDSGKSKEDVTKALTNFRLGITPEKPQKPAATYPIPAEDSAPMGTANVERRNGQLYSSSKPTEDTPGPFSGLGHIKDAAVSGVKQFGKGFGQTVEGVKEGNFNKIGQGMLNEAGGGIATAFSPVTGILQSGAEIPGIKQGVEATDKGVVQPLAEHISNNPVLQKFVTDNPNAPEVIQNLMTVFGTLALGKLPKVDGVTGIKSVDTGIENTANAVKQKFSSEIPSITVNGRKLTLDEIHSGEGHDFFRTLKPEDQKLVADFDNAQSRGSNFKGQKFDSEGQAGPTAPGVTSGLAKNVAKDILPTSDRLVNFQVSRALDLTQGDIKNINLSTGNEVGQWVADKNLIGNNKAATIKNIEDFYKTNYNAVRTEIGKVKATYDPLEVPRYSEALRSIKEKITGRAGLQEANAEVDSLLKKPRPTLSDVQRAKELMDEHFNLYKATGDVGQGVEKEGLANIRKDMREWIENEVSDRGGADIKGLNNNVQTARSIANAVEARSTRGLTRSNLKLGDLGVFAVGSGVGTPLFGAALVIAKKIIESPTFRLRFAQILDGFSDATKARVAADLEKGIVPKEIKSIQSESKIPSPKSSSSVKGSNTQEMTDTTNASNRDIPKSTISPENVKSDDISVYRYEGGAKGAQWQQIKDMDGKDASAFGKNGISVSLDNKSSSMFGDELKTAKIPGRTKLYDLTKIGDRTDAIKDPNYRKWFVQTNGGSKPGSPDFVEYMARKGYDGVKYLSDDNASAWADLKPGFNPFK